MCFIVTENGTLLKRLFVHRLGPVATISLAQLFGTSLWFSANGISDSLALVWQASVKDIGWLTNAVQLGFIFGTLVISLTGIADRYRASTLYIISALTGAVLNAGFAWLAGGVISGALFRFGVGICLAGIYPMGMKLIVSWVSGKTGLALSVLVAMLTLGTALPHGLRVLGADVSWQVIISASSALALLSAAVIGVIGDGPYQPQNPEPNTTLAHVRMSSGSILRVFDISGFRAASLGYFGHMWELYTFWTIIPMIIQHTSLALVWPQLGAGLAFCLIGVGAFGSVTGDAFSVHWQRKSCDTVPCYFRTMLLHFCHLLAGATSRGSITFTTDMGSYGRCRFSTILLSDSQSLPGRVSRQCACHSK